jgi:hypothetical protein
MVCSPSCGYEYANKQKQKDWKKRKKKLKEELLTVQDLMKLAQASFNAYIRQRDKDKPCISCDNKLVGKFDAGHFYSSGGHKAVTFDENNVHGQCVACNQHKHGNLLEYQPRLIERIGQHEYDELTNLSKQTRKYTREELKTLTKHYKDKLKALKQLNNKK